MNKFINPHLLSISLLFASAYNHVKAADLDESPKTINANWNDYYLIENILIPSTIDPQIGGLTWLDNNKLAVAFHRGEVAIYDPRLESGSIDDRWHLFASVLHQPLGVVEDATGALVVMQNAELTRLVDTNKSGQADWYQTITDDFGMTGNYHEFAFGPATDQDGNFYIALNLASNYAGLNKIIRGEFHPLGLSRETMTDFRNDQWKNETRHKAGRMFSKVPYRGWILKVSPHGDTTPFASGFRSPDGLFVDANNQLWVTDNQGDWLGTSPLYKVDEGHFYGHPASLVWKDNWPTHPTDMTAEQLDVLRTRATALFPHGELANSPTQPISTTGSVLGLPANEMLIGDMNQPRLIRFLADNVNGVTQGTLIPFLEHDELGIGNHRFTVDNEGNLLLGKTHLGWAGDEGIRKISLKDDAPFIVTKVNMVPGGFLVSFNEAIDSDALKVQITSHSYHYHNKYGSEKTNIVQESHDEITVYPDLKKVFIPIKPISINKLYTITLEQAKSQSQRPLLGHILRYNVLSVP